MKKIDVRIQEKQKKEMEEIRAKTNPSIVEKYKYIKYLIHEVPENERNKEIEHLASLWGEDDVQKILKDVESESKKLPPKKYYVSLRDPLEDPMTR
ncbi:hypothetical protein COY95_05210 [Candidatus Woesearchaeota archaeon CG_4_10_14_0_8_um_filter_47_5]|nr:MAG: hypothetical protein COY95_05210 [Candidatus Woesearchaeota archaeon CG_4_10_14_0_8_um_filter_47_5]